MGSRDSNLARIQTRFALDRLCERVPGLRFEESFFSSPGDREQDVDLRKAPPDFFTRDLDEALLDGRLDAALHSAKDMPEQFPDGIDWVWLPWREDARDALVLASGRGMADLPSHPVAGVSSPRREAWCRKHFPNAELRPIRGTIERRLAQLDDGGFDLLIMAGAALSRLGLENRITQWIPIEELSPPDGQGVLGLSFRAKDRRFRCLRDLFVKTVTLAGAGVGDAEQATMACVAALRMADVCLFDALIAPGLLDLLPSAARRFDVGKRCGESGAGQDTIVEQLLLHARRGNRVVRLKGGDPGLFGRLAEETEALEAHGLAFRVLPGISSLQAATGAGFLLTRRGVSRGFTVMTPREQQGGIASIRMDERARLPMVLFMALRVADDVVEQLRADGWPDETPVALVFSAGSEDETILQSTLAGMPELVKTHRHDRPGLMIIGEAARRSYSRSHGALAGKRILLTCSRASMEKAAQYVRDFGGLPVCRSLLKITPCKQALEVLRGIAGYDWVVLTSPSAVFALFELMDEAHLDIRQLPRVIVCGPGTAFAVNTRLVRPALMPVSDFEINGLKTILAQHVESGSRVLRLRSDLAGSAPAGVIAELGAKVDDVVLYRNERIEYDKFPGFDAAVITSASAARRLVEILGASCLAQKDLAAIGAPTVLELRRHGLTPAAIAGEATVGATVFALAAKWAWRAMAGAETR